MLLSVCMYPTDVPGTSGDERRLSNPMQVELQTVVRDVTWVLGTQVFFESSEYS